MLVNSLEILKKAKEGRYAIPSPDFFNQSSLKAYVEVAQELNKPIIIAHSEAFKDILSIEEAALLGQYYAKKATVPVVLHVDHGFSLDFIKACIDAGFTSVMIDASKESFAENVRRTKEIVDYAHPKNVTVEAEIGHVGSGVNYENHDMTDSIYTDVDTAVKFVELTGVDALAVSIGTAHGQYKGTPVLNFERLKDLREAIDVPLVLHGGSSTGDDNLKQCSQLGITKINLFTDIVTGGYEAMRQSTTCDLVELNQEAILGMKKVLKHYYQLFCSQE